MNGVLGPGPVDRIPPIWLIFDVPDMGCVECAPEWSIQHLDQQAKRAAIELLRSPTVAEDEWLETTAAHQFQLYRTQVSVTDRWGRRIFTGVPDDERSEEIWSLFKSAVFRYYRQAIDEINRANDARRRWINRVTFAEQGTPMDPPPMDISPDLSFLMH